jgi:hypothetical protein
MERHLRNLKLWVGRYLENERNYPGLHLTADKAACDALRGLMVTFRKDCSGSPRTLLLRKLAPADEAKITGGQRYQDFAKLKIKLSQVSEELQFMSAGNVGDVVYLEFTPSYLDRFEEGIADVACGQGDYCICPPDDGRNRKAMAEKDRASLELWFWPCFGHLHPVP